MASTHWSAQPLVDGQTMKINSNNELTILPRALNIVWGNDNRYWRWIKFSTKGFESEDAAELLQVNWLEITGKLDFCHLKEPDEAYEIIYIVKFNVDAFGWHSCAVKFKVETSDGEVAEISRVVEEYRKRTGIWHEILGGEFRVNKREQGSVRFGMYETETDWWKGSMILKGVKVRPKSKVLD